MNRARSRVDSGACRGWKISLNTISNARRLPASRRKPPATRRCETSCSGSPSRSRRSPSTSNSTEHDADLICSNFPGLERTAESETRAASARLPGRSFFGFRLGHGAFALAQFDGMAGDQRQDRPDKKHDQTDRKIEQYSACRLIAGTENVRSNRRSRQKRAQEKPQNDAARQVDHAASPSLPCNGRAPIVAESRGGP